MDAFKIGDEITFLNDDWTLNKIVKIKSVINKKLNFETLLIRKDGSVKWRSSIDKHDCEIYEYE